MKKNMKEINTGIKEMIYKGLCNGAVKIIQNPNDGCIACEIG